MSFDTRIPPALRSARFNHIIVDRDGEEVIGYAYSVRGHMHKGTGQ